MSREAKYKTMKYVLIAATILAMALYGVLSFTKGCGGAVAEIRTEQQAIKAATAMLIEKASSDELALAEDEQSMEIYILKNPQCCSARKTVSILYWGYVWNVTFYLAGYINGRPIEEYAVISITSCGNYNEFNWLSDH